MGLAAALDGHWESAPGERAVLQLVGGTPLLGYNGADRRPEVHMYQLVGPTAQKTWVACSIFTAALCVRADTHPPAQQRRAARALRLSGCWPLQRPLRPPPAHSRPLPAAPVQHIDSPQTVRHLPTGSDTGDEQGQA